MPKLLLGTLILITSCRPWRWLKLISRHRHMSWRPSSRLIHILLRDTRIPMTRFTRRQ